MGENCKDENKPVGSPSVPIIIGLGIRQEDKRMASIEAG